MSNLLIGIGGGIAAYKVCEIVSTLAKSEHHVRAILSPQATAFITPLTLSALCRHPVYTEEDLWSRSRQAPLHIELAEWADVILIAPLTANTLAELRQGFAHHLLSNVVLASTVPILLAPAMNTVMWNQPIVQENIQHLLAWGRYHSIGPTSGLLACDAVGIGKMAAPTEILDYVNSLFLTEGKQDLKTKTLLISAGGTREFMDPVRFIGNPSTGKMGIALALAAVHRGATVQLVCGQGVNLPVSLPIHATTVTTASEMQQSLETQLPQVNWIIMAAAVADFAPTHYSDSKVPKRSLSETLAISPVPDIIQGLAQAKQPEQRIIGFAAQTGDIVTPAREKLKRKGLDAIVANPIDRRQAGFGSDRNQAVWIDKSGQTAEIPSMSKLKMAHRILDLTLALG